MVHGRNWSYGTQKITEGGGTDINWRYGTQKIAEIGGTNVKKILQNNELKDGVWMAQCIGEIASVERVRVQVGLRPLVNLDINAFVHT